VGAGRGWGVYLVVSVDRVCYLKCSTVINLFVWKKRFQCTFDRTVLEVKRR